MEPAVIAVLVGVTVYILVVALIPKNILAETTRYTRNMLARIEKESAERLRQEEEVSVVREQIYKSNAITRVFFTLPGSQAAYPHLLRAGLGNNVDTIFMVFVGILLALVYVLRAQGVLGILYAFVITYALAYYFVRNRARKRNELFLNGFPDALDMIVRSVKSGYPLNAAVRVVAENTRPPISNEFKQVSDEAMYGSSLVDALTRMSERINEPDIRFFVVVLAVQQDVGGNLAEVLSNLSSIIRKRKHMRLKIKALTAEGRATSWVLSALPVFLFAVIHHMNPQHMLPFFDSLLGNIWLATAIGVVALGSFIIKQMVNIDI